MLVASDNINGVAEFEWTVEGDKGAIELPDYLAYDLCNRPGGHYWAVENGKPVAAPKEEAPEPNPEVELQDDGSFGNELDQALDAADVTTKKPAAKKAPAKKAATAKTPASAKE